MNALSADDVQQLAELNAEIGRDDQAIRKLNERLCRNKKTRQYVLDKQREVDHEPA